MPALKIIFSLSFWEQFYFAPHTAFCIKKYGFLKGAGKSLLQIWLFIFYREIMVSKSCQLNW
jgi:hypothetical protein